MILDNGTTIQLKRKFNVSVEELFGCFSSIDAWKGWWKGLDVMKMDFNEGGEIYFSWKHSKATKHGQILEIKKNEILRFTWSSGDYIHDSKDPCSAAVKDTEVIFKFTRIEDKVSERKLIHRLNKKEHNLNGHYEGWTWALLDLDQVLNGELRREKKKQSVELERIFNAPVERVYELWTKPELLNKWFNTKEHTESYTYSNLEVEGCYALDYHDVSGKETGVAGTLCRIIGEYKEIIPNKKLVFSWIDEGFQYESLVTINFSVMGEKTKVHLIHSDVYDKDWIKQFKSGWTHCLGAQIDLFNK